MKYVMIFNDEEIRANGDEPSPHDVADEARELLRSGYYEVEHVEVFDEGISQDSDAVQA